MVVMSMITDHPRLLIPCKQCVIPHISHDMFEKYVLSLQSTSSQAVSFAFGVSASDAYFLYFSLFKQVSNRYHHRNHTKHGDGDMKSKPTTVVPSIGQFTTLDRYRDIPIVLTCYEFDVPIPALSHSDNAIFAETAAGRMKIEIPSEFSRLMSIWKPDAAIVPFDRSMYMCATKKKKEKCAKRNELWRKHSVYNPEIANVQWIEEDSKFTSALSTTSMSNNSNGAVNSSVYESSVQSVDQLFAAVLDGKLLIECVFGFSFAEMGYLLNADCILGHMARFEQGNQPMDMRGLEEFLNLRSTEFRFDKSPIDSAIPHSKAYVYHLFSAHEMLGITLLAIANLKGMYSILEKAFALKHAGVLDAWVACWNQR
eukprot:ANDGO_01629.mRNA.1 hypothetical protein